MYYTKVKEDGELVFPYSLYDLRKDFPNTSFNAITLVEIDQDFLEDNGIHPVTIEHPQWYDAMLYKLSEMKIKVVDNGDEDNPITNYVAYYDIVELSDEEKNFRMKDKENEVRMQRFTLLSGCDWTMVSDAPTDKEAWAAYRQELRDVTNQEGFPTNVVWPTPPGN
jgi:hypothetical protein